MEIVWKIRMKFSQSIEYRVSFGEFDLILNS